MLLLATTITPSLRVVKASCLQVSSLTEASRMSAFFRSVWRTVTVGRHFVGKDLQGNKYFEYPETYGRVGRPKRMVKYSKFAEKNGQGIATIPIQWNAWLSHTRPSPPSLGELRVDAGRMEQVRMRAFMLDQEERQRRQVAAPLEPQSQEEIDTPPLSSLLAHKEEVTPQEKPQYYGDQPDYSAETQAWVPRTSVRRGE